MRVDLRDGLEVRLCDVELVAVQRDDALAEVCVGIVRVVAEDGGQFVSGFVEIRIGGRVEQGDRMVDPGGEPLGGGRAGAGEFLRSCVEIELFHQADAAVGCLHGGLGNIGAAAAAGSVAIRLWCCSRSAGDERPAEQAERGRRADHGDHERGRRGPRRMGRMW